MRRTIEDYMIEDNDRIAIGVSAKRQPYATGLARLAKFLPRKFE